jgi:hypothetical protein
MRPETPMNAKLHALLHLMEEHDDESAQGVKITPELFTTAVGGGGDVVLPLLFCALVVGDDLVSRDELMRGQSSIRPTGGTSRTEHHIPCTRCDLKPLHP